MKPNTNTPKNPQEPSSESPSTLCSASLVVPAKRPDKWKPGDIAIKYITLRRDDDPMPPCVLVMVSEVLADGEVCECEHLDQNHQETIKSTVLDGVAEALDYYEKLTDEMTVKSARLGREKLEALAKPFAPFPDWVRLLAWWDANPEHRPDGYPVMRQIIPLNPYPRTP
jgi:hypothetical protein